MQNAAMKVSNCYNAASYPKGVLGKFITIRGTADMTAKERKT